MSTVDEFEFPMCPRKGRGAIGNPDGRFESRMLAQVDNGWDKSDDKEQGRLRTTLTPDKSRSVISRNNSPDVSFKLSVNPYRGCEHGCVYCFARPSHSYLGLSPGLDFETKLFYKADAARILEAELAAPNYKCSPIMIGANTDPYQPLEKTYRVTRSLLEVLVRCRHPVTITTKGALVARDVDLLAEL